MHLSGHYIFSIKFEAFFFTNKNIPQPPKVKRSNIEYSEKLFFFPREVRDKNKESSIYTQNPELWTFVWSFCTWQNVVTVQRGVWRYQGGNQNSYIEEEETIQWPKEKGQTTIYETYT